MEEKEEEYNWSCYWLVHVQAPIAFAVAGGFADEQ